MTSPVFDRATVRRYTDAHCARLACSLRFVTWLESESEAWSIAGVASRPVSMGVIPGRLDHPDHWQHAMCRTPEGLYVDVTGIHTAGTVRKLWEGKVRTPRNQIDALVHLFAFWQAPSSSDSREVARCIYEEWRVDPSPRAFVPLDWLRA